MSDEIDAIIAEGNSVEAQPETKEEDAVTETPEVEASEPEEAVTKTEDLFPKKAVNALSYRDKKIGRLQAEKQAVAERNKQLEEKLAKYEARGEVKDEAPKEEDFEGQPYANYLRAEARFAAKQELSETQSKQTEERSKAEQKEWEAERAEALDTNASEAKAAFSDFDSIIDKAIPKTGLPDHVKKAFLEADNGAFALYALAKEGMLEDLADMSPTKVAMMIGRMEDKGLTLSKQKQITKTPAPMTPSKGIAAGSKNTDRMSAQEVYDYYMT